MAADHRSSIGLEIVTFDQIVAVTLRPPFESGSLLVDSRAFLTHVLREISGQST